MIDKLIVLTYLISLLAIGIIKRSKKSGFKGFTRVSNLPGKNKLILVATIFASSIGGGTIFGITEKAFTGEIAYSYGLLLAIPVDILIAVYIVPKLIVHYGSETIGDIMAVYYGKAGRYLAGFAAIVVSIGLIAAQISVSGRIFAYILQVNYIQAVILSYSIVVIYTTIGGFRSVLFTNQLQFIAIIIAIPIISIFGLYQIGSGNFYDQLPAQKISLFGDNNLIITSFYIALNFSVMNLFPTFIQRTLINKETGETKKALYIKSVIYGIFLIFVTVNGLLAYLIYPDVESVIALPFLIDHIVPTGAKGIVIAGLLAAVMSTADSDLNVTSITLVKDFFSPLLKIKNQQTMLIIARVTNIIVGSFAILIALKFNSVVDLVIFMAGFWGPIILVPLVSGLFNIIVTNKRMIIASLSGGTAFLLWELSIPDTTIKGVFIGTIANLVIFLISYITSRQIR